MFGWRMSTSTTTTTTTNRYHHRNCSSPFLGAYPMSFADSILLHNGRQIDTHTPGKTSDKKENTAQKPTGVSETYKNPLKDTAETEKSLTPFSVRNKRQIEDVFSDAITTALKTSATTTTSSTSNNNKHQKCRSFSLLL